MISPFNNPRQTPYELAVTHDTSGSKDRRLRNQQTNLNSQLWADSCLIKSISSWLFLRFALSQTRHSSCCLKNFEHAVSEVAQARRPQLRHDPIRIANVLGIATVCRIRGRAGPMRRISDLMWVMIGSGSWTPSP